MEKNFNAVYNSFDPEHEQIKLYNPKYLDKGGDHLVYEIEGHPNIVVKASTYKIKDILSENSGGNLMIVTPGLESKLRDEIEQKNSQNRNLKKYFGDKAVLNEKRYLIKVPISPEIIEEIFQNDWKHRIPPEGYQELKEVWTVAVIQKKSEMTTSPASISFNFGSLIEDTKIEQVTLNNLNESLLASSELDETDINSFFQNVNTTGKSNLKNIHGLIATDPQFKIVFDDLILRIIKHTRETGNILALAGNNNLIFSKNTTSGLWEYNLIDVLPVHSEQMFDLSKKLVEKYLVGQSISETEKIILVKTLNFVRVINFFAKSLDIEDYLNILPDINTPDLTRLGKLSTQ